METMTLGRRIAQLRKEKELKQDDLAQMLDVSAQAVSKWENDLAVPDALKMIQLADILDTDIEYLSSGRRNFARRPPVVLTEVKVVEKVVEKPVTQIQTVEKVVEVPVVQYIDRPVIKRISRVKYLRNPFEFLLTGVVSFLIGMLIGSML